MASGLNAKPPNPCEQNGEGVGRRRRGPSPSEFLEIVSFRRCFNDILGFLMKTMTGKVMSPDLEGSFSWGRGWGLGAPGKPMQRLPGIDARISRDKEKARPCGQRRL